MLPFKLIQSIMNLLRPDVAEFLEAQTCLLILDMAVGVVGLPV
jgi:hypothetical protein